MNLRLATFAALFFSAVASAITAAQNAPQPAKPAAISPIIPNIEMHIYGNGVHANGLKDRAGTPFGTWQDRYIDWFRDLGFLQKPGIETKASLDVKTFVSQPQHGSGRGSSLGSQSGSRAATNAPAHSVNAEPQSAAPVKP